MDERATLVGEAGSSGEGLNRADFVVGGLDGQQQGVVPEHRFEGVEVRPCRRGAPVR